jgi:hypothetical protein
LNHLNLLGDKSHYPETGKFNIVVDIEYTSFRHLG